MHMNEVWGNAREGSGKEGREGGGSGREWERVGGSGREEKGGRIYYQDIRCKTNFCSVSHTPKIKPAGIVPKRKVTIFGSRDQCLGI